MPMGQADPEYRREEGYVDRRHKEYKRSSEESFHRRRPSPYHDSAHFEGRGEGPRHRDAYRENKGRYEDRRGPPKPALNRHYTQRDPGWRRDQPDRDSRESYRDRSPIRKEQYQQRGRGQQRRKIPIHTDTWTPSQDNPESNRSRDMDGSPQFGYGWEKPHEHRFSADDRREGFDRNARGPFEFEQNRMNPVMDPVEHGPPRRREQFSHSRERDFPPRPRSSRSLSREDQRGGHFEEIHRSEGYQEARRSPIPHESPSTFSQYTDRPTNRGRPANRGRGFNRRGGFNHRGRGRGAYSNRPNFQNAPEEMQSTQLTEEEYYDKPDEDEEPDQEWREDRQRSEGRGGRDEGDGSNFPRQELEMQQRSRELRGHNESKPNMMVITEETLTIKVDMSRPVNKNR